MKTSSIFSKAAVFVLTVVFTFVAGGCGDGSLADTLAEGMGRQIQAQEQAAKEKNAAAPAVQNQQKPEVSLYEEMPEGAPTAPMAEKPAREIKRLFMIGNDGVMNNGGTPAQFTLGRRTYLDSIGTYHWNDQQGSTPGTVQIRDASGKIYGPWPATGRNGQGGVPNAYWTVYPKMELPAGTYTIIDSDPASWSQNEGTGGQGSSWADGYEVE